MKVISPANATVMQMLKNFRKPGEKYRKLNYLVDTEVEDGILLFNLFTRELILLDQEEFKNAINNEYLRQQWFIVPEECNEKAYVDLVREFLKAKKPNFEEITSYTIFTTTDCNARCFYCFENGAERIKMTQETATKISNYIVQHSPGQSIKINWFGGEPLFNAEVIDIICKNLTLNNINFESTMISNGYLFDEENIKKAKSLWRIKTVQISLDGTESVYNRIKAYIYSEGNPYQIVLNNIERLLEESINVNIRLNMDLYNASNLEILIDELHNRYMNKPNLSVYAHHIFDKDLPDGEIHSAKEWKMRSQALQRINNKLSTYNLNLRSGISKTFKANQCMADSGKAITILPNGDIGLCEHKTNSEFIGHIDHAELNQKIISSWQQKTPEITECSRCFYYPECYKLLKCTNANVCYEQYRIDIHNTTTEKIIFEYKNSKMLNPTNTSIGDNLFI